MTREPPLSAGLTTMLLLFFNLLRDENSSGVRLYCSSETIYVLPNFLQVLLLFIISAVIVSISLIVSRAADRVPFLNSNELFGVHVDFSTKVLILGSKFFETLLKAHFILIFLINLCLFSRILEIGKSLGVGIKEMPFWRRSSSASDNFREERFKNVLLLLCLLILISDGQMFLVDISLNGL